MKRRRRKRRGISLLEMILVIAIIGIIMSMMFPVIVKAIIKARNLGTENPQDPDGPRIAPNSVGAELDND